MGRARHLTLAGEEGKGLPVALANLCALVPTPETGQFRFKVVSFYCCHSVSKTRRCKNF